MKNKNEHMNDLLNDGFLSLNNSILSEDEIKNLSIKCFEALGDCESVSYKDVKENIINDHFERFDNKKIINTFFRQKIRHILGVSKEIDYFIGKIISHNSVKEILNYLFSQPKCHACVVRMADGNSIPLGIHSDGPNEITISFLLNDLTENDTTTVLIKSSHLFPTSVKNTLERISPKFFSFLTTAITGYAGTINFFFNRTAHGVQKGSGNKSTAIMIGFHDNQHEEFKNLILPEETIKNIDCLKDTNFPINYFESNSENLRYIKKEHINMNTIGKYRKINIKERLIYYFLIFSGYLIKFLKKIKSLI